MAVMTKAEVKKLLELDDRILDVLDLLKSKRVLDAKMHRTILLEGYKRLVAFLQQKKIITASEASQAMKKGLDYLLPRLAR
jgi:hypothetical protein